jgi:hypothetical protein
MSMPLPLPLLKVYSIEWTLDMESQQAARRADGLRVPAVH